MTLEKAQHNRRIFRAATLVAIAFIPLFVAASSYAQAADSSTAIRPFHFKASEAQLVELRKRIKATQWPEKETVADTSQGVQGLHLEARYNYENLRTGSVWFGYNISAGKELVLNVTPMIGSVFGQSSGIAPGCEASLSYKRVTLSISRICLRPNRKCTKFLLQLAGSDVLSDRLASNRLGGAAYKGLLKRSSTPSEVSWSGSPINMRNLRPMFST